MVVQGKSTGTKNRKEASGDEAEAAHRSEVFAVSSVCSPRTSSLWWWLLLLLLLLLGLLSSCFVVGKLTTSHYLVLRSLACYSSVHCGSCLLNPCCSELFLRLVGK